MLKSPHLPDFNLDLPLHQSMMILALGSICVLAFTERMIVT